MRIRDDVNNRRIRQLIEQFNAEEAYEAELREAREEIDKLLSESAPLSNLLAALRKFSRKMRTPRLVNAVGTWAESSSSHQ